jgi:hypothetical protein
VAARGQFRRITAPTVTPASSRHKECGRAHKSMCMVRTRAESAAHWTRHDAYPLRSPRALSHDYIANHTIEALSIYMLAGRNSIRSPASHV